MKLAVSLCALAAVAVAAPANAQNMLTNPGFESGLSGWTGFGNQFAESITPRSGSGVAKMFGNFSGGFNVSGLFQTFPAAPGQNWSFDAYFRHNTGDLMTGVGIPGGGSGNWVIAKLEFRNASDAVTGFVESAPVRWHQHARHLARAQRRPDRPGQHRLGVGVLALPAAAV